jgi:hypothetical protein
MSKPLIIAFLTAIGFGYFLVNPWVLFYYLFFLAFATAVVLVIVVLSLIKRTRDWKTAILCLAVGYTAVLSSYGIQSYLSSRIVKQRDLVIVALYNYRDKYGGFPETVQQVSCDVSSLRANYVPDAGLRNFTLYTKDIFGMPWVFSSKDSTWTR